MPRRASCAPWGAVVTARSYLALLERAREIVPGVALRSTFIAGFPGETDDDVEQLLDFIAAAGLAVAGVFPYDPQEGTLAATLPDQVPSALRDERATRVGDAIARAARSYWESFVGKTVDVLVERGSRGASPEVLGRIAQQAPDVDGLISVQGALARRGQIVRAVVDDVAGYHLLAHPLP